MARGTDQIVAITVNSGNKKWLEEITLESVMFSSIHMHVVGGVFSTEVRVCLSCMIVWMRLKSKYCHSSDFCQV